MAPAKIPKTDKSSLKRTHLEETTSVMIKVSRWKVPLICAALACTVYINSLDLEFCFDDHSAIKDNADLRPDVPWSNLLWDDFWGMPMHVEGSHKSYRPLCVLTFRLNYLFHQLKPFGYHLGNVMLHALVTCLYVKLCRDVFDCGEKTALVAGVLFAVHPIHTEAVAGVVGRAETLSSIFFLSCLFTYKKACNQEDSTRWSWLLFTLLLCILSVLSKEVGITVVAICLTYDIFLARKLTLLGGLSALKNLSRGNTPRWLKPLALRIVAVVLFFVAVMAARVKIMAASLPTFVIHDNPAMAAPTPVRQWTWLHLCFVNFWLLLSPSRLCPDWTMQTVPLVESLADLRNLATGAVFLVVIVLGLMSVLGRRRSDKTVLMGHDNEKFGLYLRVYELSRSGKERMALSLIIFPFVPASNLFFPVGFVVAERILYVPSMGFSLLIAVGVVKIMNTKWLKHLATLALVYLVMVHSAKTVVRNREWYSDLTLFTAAIHVNPNNGKLYSNLGHQYEHMKNYSYAEHLFRQGTEIQPDDAGAFMNLGRALKAMDRLEEAEKAYRAGIALLPDFKKEKRARIAPNHINLYYNLANLLRTNESRLEEADKLYRLATKMKKDFVDAYINRGDVLIHLNRSDEALEEYRKAILHGPTSTMAFFNLATLHLQRGEKAEAAKYYKKTLELDPTYKLAMHNLAVLKQERREPAELEEAIRLFKGVLQVDPTDTKAMSSLALAYVDKGDTEEAIHWLRRTVEVDPNSRAPLYNLAVMMTRNKRHAEAVPLLNQLLVNHPTYINGYHLLGECHYRLKSPTKAIEAYKSALRIDPRDQVSLHNLGVVYADVKMWREAEGYLKKVLELNPGDKVATERLAAVQAEIEKGGR